MAMMAECGDESFEKFLSYFDCWISVIMGWNEYFHDWNERKKWFMVWLPKTKKVRKKWKKDFYSLEKDVWLKNILKNDVWIENDLKAIFGLKVMFGWKMI